jgi:hypothetical protein
MTEGDGARRTRQLAKGHQAMRLQVPDAYCFIVACGHDKWLGRVGTQAPDLALAMSL